MRLAMAEFAFVAIRAKRESEHAEIEGDDNGNDRKAGNRPEHGIVDDIGP